MKTTLSQIIAITAIATLTACGTTRSSKPSAQAAPVTPKKTALGVQQLNAQPTEFVEFTKDPAGNVVTNRLTSHLITGLPKKRSFADANGSSDLERHMALERSMELELELIWSALEHRKNIEVLGTRYGASSNEIVTLKKLFAPTISGDTNGTARATGAAPQLGLGAIYHTPTEEAELRRQFEELRFQEWKAKQYRAKGFK